MNHIKKAVTTLGGIFLVALLIAALAPKTTHGLAAALVDVANTRSGPVPVDAVRQSASNFLTLEARAFGASPVKSVTSSWSQLLPDGTLASGYALPAGEQLVVTDVNVGVVCTSSFGPFGGLVCPSAGSLTSVVIFPSTSGLPDQDDQPNYYISSLTYQADQMGGLFAAHSDHLTSGIVFSSLPKAAFNANFGNDDGERFTITIQGYLTP